MTQEALSRDEAIAKARDMDQRRRRWTQFLYDAEVRDPVSFDLVLNIGKITIEEGIELVAAEARKPQFQADEQSMKRVRDIHLAAVAETHLMNFPGTYGLDLDVSADSSSGKVTVRAVSPTTDAKSLEEDIRSALSSADGVKSVEIDIRPGS